jgi:hypothetical protein
MTNVAVIPIVDTGTMNVNPFIDPDIAVPDTFLFHIVDIDNGSFLGVAGLSIDRDDVNGYDAVWGWQSAISEERSRDPYKNLDEAINGLIAASLT